MEVFLITTIHNRESRWEYIKNHLEGIGLVNIPILAPDYRLFSGLTEQQAKHQSLTLSYLHIAQRWLFKPFGHYAVIEDDVQFCEGFAENFIKLGINTPADWDFVYATKTAHNKEAGRTIPVNDYICKVIGDWWETPITVWNERIIKTFNDRMMAKIGKEHLGNIDHELLRICEEGELNFYGSEKNIANGLSTARHLADETISFEGSIS